MDCRSPTEAALFPPTPPTPTDLEDYREELIMSLSSARETAVKCIRQAHTGCLYMETSNMAAILHIFKTLYFRSAYMCMKFE